MSDVPALLGRDAVLARCRAGLAEGGGVLLTGPAGIGKSAVLDALGAEAAEAGALVLRSNSSAAEASLPGLALYDLFARPVAQQDGLIAPHLRAVLDGALLRAPADNASAHGSPGGRLALRVAVLELLRSLAAARPVLLVLDDAHCLDPVSAQVLAFAARRLPGHRVRVAAAERLADGREPHRLDVLPEPRTELTLSPLPPQVVGELLRTRLGLAPADRLSERIRTAAGGNPLHALELARAARRPEPHPQSQPHPHPQSQPGPNPHPQSHPHPHPGFPDRPLPVPERLRALLPVRPDLLPRETVDVLLLVATADAPLRHLPAAAERALAEARAAGVVRGESGGGLRFADPLFREIVLSDATDAQRRACHAALAGLLDDPVERARHRALASPGPGAELAAELADAARLAAGRGAPALAAELSRLAAERTPGDPGLAGERLLAGARYAYDAGLCDQARQVCAALLDGQSRAARVGARLLLVELAGGDRSGVPALLAAAQTDAGDNARLRAAVRLCRAEHAISTGQTGLGLAELARAERQADRSGDLEQQIEVIALRAPIEMQVCPDPVLPSLRRATVLAAELAAGRPAAAMTAASVQVRCCLVVGLLRRGEVAEAIDAVNLLRTDVENAGRVKDLGDVLHLVASVHERAGLCGQAYRAGVRGGRLRAELGPTPGPGLVLSAAAELNGGTAERAGELAAAAIRAGELAGDAEWSAYALGIRGRADLLGHRTAQAAEHLGRCRALLRGLGFVDPALFLVDADLVEALARSGATDEARRVLAEATRETARLDRRVVRLGLARARAVLTGLDGDPRGAADALRSALPAGHPYPLETARARLTLGDLERRARRRAAARADLRAAAQAFAAARSLPWLDHARERLARLDGPASALSDLERQIVELVQRGATNRQIAGELHVSVKSVEGSLTRLFRRFGVHTRTELTLARTAG
ncbi:LuxR family transcriptional regulator [Kitasatospora kazusensis]|uniref:LuxR family transcriptional regulator n=1 Tax=Kitasatospora kazusensis TaxID=407974 RepID=A0ABN2Z844_9ACTN